MSLTQSQNLVFTSTAPSFAPILSTASSDFKDQINKAKIPLLTEALSLCKRTSTHIALEMKDSGVEHDSLRVVENYGMQGLVTLSSFHNEKTALIRKMRRDTSVIRTGKIFEKFYQKTGSNKLKITDATKLTFASLLPLLKTSLKPTTTESS